ncbi:hypothetical protein M5G13_27330, partial [Pseudomonas sp. TNT2022 ID609]|uniref:hypothetical protein n=1 Tax=Pseudomonas rubra TaxID=2942627 RepID=UPI00235F490B
YTKATHAAPPAHGTLQQMWEPVLPAMRRAGGARSQERHKPQGKHLAAITQSAAVIAGQARSH